MPKAKKKANKESSEAPGAGLSQDIGDEMTEVNPLTDSQLDQMTVHAFLPISFIEIRLRAKR